MSIASTWKKWTCGHRTTATKTWYEDGAVMRKGVCLECGQDTMPEPLPSDVLMRMVEEASRAQRKASTR